MLIHTRFGQLPTICRNAETERSLEVVEKDRKTKMVHAGCRRIFEHGAGQRPGFRCGAPSLRCAKALFQLKQLLRRDPYIYGGTLVLNVYTDMETCYLDSHVTLDSRTFRYCGGDVNKSRFPSCSAIAETAKCNMADARSGN